MSNERTERLYYDDSYLGRFPARVVEARSDPTRAYLDRTAFYPTSGGQPFDTGTVGGVRVVDVVDEGERIAHLLASPIESESVECEIDWLRRFDQMQQHSGQHLLSSIFADSFGVATLSFSMGAELSAIELSVPSLSSAQLETAELRANELVQQNRAITITYENAAEATELRKPSERTGVLRVITIDGLDRSACGGTHVRATGEIGAVLLRGIEKVRGNVRVEFVCGGRAIRRARADYHALSSIGRALSAPIDGTPGLVSAQREKLREGEKVRQKLAGELAMHRGKALYREASSSANGLRVHIAKIAEANLDEAASKEAQAFCSGSKGAYLVYSSETVLLAVSNDSGLHAGNVLKAALAAVGGRGGGAANLAQGSISSPEGLDRVLSMVRTELFAV